MSSPSPAPGATPDGMAREDNSPNRRLAALALSGDARGMTSALGSIQKLLGKEATLQAICSCDFGDRNSKSALHCAAARGRAEVLRILLAARVDPNSRDDTGNTPLHFAVDLGHARAVRVLLEGGAMQDLLNNFGKSAARNSEENSWDQPQIKVGKAYIRNMFAGQFTLWEDLPEEPPEVSVEADSLLPQKMRPITQPPWQPPEPKLLCVGQAVPFGCWMEKGPEIPKSLQRTSEITTVAALSEIASLADLDPDDPCDPAEQVGPPTLVDLVRRGETAAVEARLADILHRQGQYAVLQEVTNIEEDSQDTRVVQSPLHCAAGMGNSYMLRILLATRANPNLTNDSGDTPLHVAASLGHESAVRTLVALGADPRLRNNFGKSPGDRAQPDDLDRDDVRSRKLRARITIGKLPQVEPL